MIDEPPTQVARSGLSTAKLQSQSNLQSPFLGELHVANALDGIDLVDLDATILLHQVLSTESELLLLDLQVNLLFHGVDC